MADQTRSVPSEATYMPVERAQLSGMHAKSSLRSTVPDEAGEPDSAVGLASAEVAAWGVDAVVGEAEIGGIADGPRVCVPHAPALVTSARTTMIRRDDRIERLTRQCSRTGSRSPYTSTPRAMRVLSGHQRQSLARGWGPHKRNRRAGYADTRRASASRGPPRTFTRIVSA